MMSSSNYPIQQPKPQALTSRSNNTSAILVSTRQKGNPVLNHIKGIAYEYTEIPADFVLGATTCALFLSLKYHKLHPEYIYGRIRALQGKYDLRLLLVLVDIEAHEESLKELSKTSLVNKVTIILSWSATEAGRYLELFKTYEYAAPTSIKGHQSTSFVDRLIDFTTVPRGVNKTDAISLVSNFGTVRTAINAQTEDISLIAGWGDKKIKRWTAAVSEPFRSERASRKVLVKDDFLSAMPINAPTNDTANDTANDTISTTSQIVEQRVQYEIEEHSTPDDPNATLKQVRERPVEPAASDGVLAALANLRK